MATAIITDSTACMPPELAERYGVGIVPLHLIFGGRTFVDSMTADTGEFYELLRSSSDRPTTAAPSPGMFLQAIERAARTSDSILCITVSRQFSAMYESARQAIELVKAESPGLDLRLVDSRNAAMAQGFVVLEAARAARDGAGIDAIIARADEMAGRVTLLAMLDTLSYLARGGRVPRVAAWAAGMLQVKPIVRFTASDIRLIARTRTRARALERMVDVLAQGAADRRVHLAVHHAHAPDDAQELLARAQERVEIAEAWVSEFTQVMGVHTGPGLTGFAFWTE
ncbi:MAG: DegV family protein [Dehalococcoidia bacterium]|nr:DegV family protein [Dehalococcoidia bacterium]